MIRRFTQTLIALFFLIAVPTLAVSADPHQLTIHNRTGVDLHKLFVAHHSSEDWDEDDDLLDGKVIQKGAEMTIHLKQSAKSWDMKVEDKDGHSMEWTNIDLNGSDDVVLEPNGKARLK